MRDRPDIDQALKILAEILETETTLTPQMRLVDADLDSLDMLEWMFELGVDSDAVLDDDAVIDSLTSATLGEIYALLVEAADRERVVDAPPAN